MQIYTRHQWRNTKAKSDGSGSKGRTPCTSAFDIIAVRLNKALINTRPAFVRPASPKVCTSGNETRTQNACASVPKRIVSYSYTVIVPCTVLYDIPINVAYKALSKYFIQVLLFVTPVHITQTATRFGPNYTLHSRN